MIHGGNMTILEIMSGFEKKYGRRLLCCGHEWQYYRLGQGTPILWLTGGLRRAALGYSFLTKLAGRHVVIAPDYPPTSSVAAFIQAFDAILETEKIGRFTLAGQSYGSLLAQAYLSKRPDRVDALVISSGGPADYNRAWLMADYLAIGLVRLLPERSARKLFLNGLRKVLPSGTGEQAEWLEVVQHIVMEELTRSDLVSHFAVAADIIRKHIVRPDVLQQWQGRLIVLSATNDPTQGSQDLTSYERLFGRPVELVDMGDTGHAGLLYDPDRYLALLERALED
jgi:pimeloyl-ACP methyl ester carboxylesterase